MLIPFQAPGHAVEQFPFLGIHLAFRNSVIHGVPDATPGVVQCSPGAAENSFLGRGGGGGQSQGEAETQLIDPCFQAPYRGTARLGTVGETRGNRVRSWRAGSCVGFSIQAVLHSVKQVVRAIRDTGLNWVLYGGKFLYRTVFTHLDRGTWEGHYLAAHPEILTERQPHFAPETNPDENVWQHTNPSRSRSMIWSGL